MRFLADEKREKRLNEVVMALTAEMLVASGLEQEQESALARTDAAVSSGRAAAVFNEMVTGLGGPSDFVSNYQQHLPAAAITVAVHADSAGYLQSVNAFRLGNAIIELGGGRRKLGDALDLSVGLSNVARIGEAVDHERPIAVVHASSEASAEVASSMIQEACKVAAEPPAARPVILEKLTAD